MRNPRGLMRRANVSGDPDRDQHFLIDERVLDRIPQHAADADFDLTHVLEIGPGTGALTDRLLAVADHVTAIEQDGNLVSFLQTEFTDDIANRRLTIIQGDALEVPLPDVTATVANLPYSISSPVLFRLLPLGIPLLVMVQREFGERMAASPGTADYGRLSVSSQHFAAVEIIETVPPSVFEPSPMVDSVLVRTLPRQPAYTVPDDELFLRCIRAIFTQRRKTVRNAIRNTTHISGITKAAEVIDHLPESLLSQRPGDLSPESFARIVREIADVEQYEGTHHG